MKKLKNKNGETLVEVLVATLIIVLCFVMICGSIVSAAKVNKKTEDMNTEFIPSTTKAGVDMKIKYKSTQSLNVQGYTTENGYYYYETN